MPTQNRKPPGSPVGGQFARSANPESALELSTDDAPGGHWPAVRWEEAEWVPDQAAVPAQAPSFRAG